MQAAVLHVSDLRSIIFKEFFKIQTPQRRLRQGTGFRGETGMQGMQHPCIQISHLLEAASKVLPAPPDASQEGE